MKQEWSSRITCGCRETWLDENRRDCNQESRVVVARLGENHGSAAFLESIKGVGRGSAAFLESITGDVRESAAALLESITGDVRESGAALLESITGDV
jgi:hypothetical protein